MASGGVSPSQAEEWLAAGAIAVGLGTQVRRLPLPSPHFRLMLHDLQLVGGDLRLASPLAEPGCALSNEELAWTQSGRAQAAALFRRLAGDGRCRS